MTTPAKSSSSSKSATTPLTSSSTRNPQQLLTTPVPLRSAAKATPLRTSSGKKIAWGRSGCDCVDGAGACDVCAICLSPLQKKGGGGDITETRCCHVFHERCLMSSKLRLSTCPMCRVPMTPLTAEQRTSLGDGSNAAGDEGQQLPPLEPASIALTGPRVREAIRCEQQKQGRRSFHTAYSRLHPFTRAGWRWCDESTSYGEQHAAVSSGQRIR